MAYLTGTFQIQVNLVLWIVRSDQKDLKLYIGATSFQFAKNQQAFSKSHQWIKIQDHSGHH